jgi:Tfp pilus assembly protein PilX
MRKGKDMKKTAYNPIFSEQGSALVIALIFLVLLTLIGISATTTTQIETQIAGNERTYAREFYVADSAWKEGVSWVNQIAGAPSPINLSNAAVVVSGTTDLDTVTDDNLLNIRNYGNVPGVSFNPANPIPAGSIDGTLNQAPRQTNYWYKIAYYQPPGTAVNTVLSGRKTEGLSKDEREFDFEITGNANNNRQIAVIITRTFVTQY